MSDLEKYLAFLARRAEQRSSIPSEGGKTTPQESLERAMWAALRFEGPRTAADTEATSTDLDAQRELSRLRVLVAKLEARAAGR